MYTIYEGEFFDTCDVLDDNRQESKVQDNLMFISRDNEWKEIHCGQLAKQILFG